MSQPLRQRVSLACLITVGGLLIGSCDKAPTQPTPPVGPPGPTVLRSTGPIAFVSNRDGTDAIYLANEDGSAVTRLTEGWAPAWSKDGQRITFVRAHHIYVINVGGSGLQQIAPGYRPSWSPDGALIAFDDFESIYTVNANGSNRRAVYSKHSPLQPVWSPRGGLIAFYVSAYDLPDSFPGLGVVTDDGSDVRHIGPFDAWQPAWSPDGSQVAFLTRSGIGVVDADGSGENRPVVGEILDVDWTADGRLIFTRPITPNYGGPSRIFIIDGGERQLIPDATAPARTDYRDSQVAWVR